MTSRTKLDAPLLAITTAVIFVLICGFALFPAETNRAAQWAFDELTTVFGAPLLLVVFCVVLFLLWLAAGKYGHIRLGGGELADRGHPDGARVHEELVLLDERLCDLLRVDRQLFWAAVLPDVDGDREPHAA